MTWGSTSSISGGSDACRACRHIAACRSRVASLGPVLCEAGVEQPPLAITPRLRTFTSRQFAAQLQPGELISTRQLAERTGANLNTTANWCNRMRQQGFLQTVERLPSQAYHGGGIRPWLYRYVPQGATP